MVNTDANQENPKWVMKRANPSRKTAYQYWSIAMGWVSDIEDASVFRTNEKEREGYFFKATFGYFPIWANKDALDALASLPS